MKWLLVALLLGGCGYKQQANEDAVAVSMPFVTGDVDGRLTDTIITALSTTGDYRYAPKDATHRLEVRLSKNKTENVGYEYRTKDNDSEVFNRLVPNEGRRNVDAEVKLIKISSGKTVLGPITVSAFSNYDYVNPNSQSDLTFDNDGVQEPVLEFSIGQFDSKEGAESASIDPAFRALAEEVVRVLVQEKSF